MKYTWINRNKKNSCCTDIPTLTANLVMLHTGHQTFPKKTDMTVSEQRELGISHHLSHAQRGGGFQGDHMFFIGNRGGYQSLLTEYKLETVEN